MLELIPTVGSPVTGSWRVSVRPTPVRYHCCALTMEPLAISRQHELHDRDVRIGTVNYVVSLYADDNTVSLTEPQ